MSSSSSGSARMPLDLRVTHEDGTVEEVSVQRMPIGGGDGDSVVVPGLPAGYALILPEPEGGFRLEIRGQGARAVDESTGGEIDRMALVPGSVFRLAGSRFECVTRGPSTAGDLQENDFRWADTCPFCGHAWNTRNKRKCRDCGENSRALATSVGPRRVPARLGAYEVVGWVGSGGMGVVLKGLTEKHSPVAIKVLRSKHPSPAAIQRFEREIGVTRDLPRHPNLVYLQGHGVVGNLRWFAMEWIEGETLADWLKRYPEGAPIDEIRRIMKQLVEGLGELHQKGVVHRDLKPSNIFLRPDGSVKIADFGLSRVGAVAGSTMTRTGEVLGTQGYMAPEQRQGRQAGPEADIYVLGLIWQEMLVGACTGGILRIGQAGAPDEWEGFIHDQLLQVDPEQRTDIGTISSMLLSSEGRGNGIGGEGEKKSESRRLRLPTFRRAATALTILAGLVGVAIVWPEIHDRLQDDTTPTAGGPSQVPGPATDKTPESEEAKFDLNTDGAWESEEALAMAEQGDALAQALVGIRMVWEPVPEERAAAGDDYRRKGREFLKKSSEQGNPLGVAAYALIQEGPERAEGVAKAIDSDFFDDVEFRPGPWKFIGGLICKEGVGLPEQNEGRAFQLFRQAADDGLAEAQCELGLCYETGNGVAQELAEAAHLYRKAAERGSPMAQFKLSNCYFYGHGVDQDKAEAVRWSKLAAEQGQVKAQNNLGYCYRTGDGMPVDGSEAAKWYRKAAEQDDPQGQAWLGWCFQNGVGVQRDEAEAMKWYRKAADQGNEKAQKALELINADVRGSSVGESKKAGLVGGKVGDGFKYSIGGAEEIVVRYVPGGRFQMGSPMGEAGRGNDEDQVWVTLSSHFWMAETEVTQGQWEAVMGGNPSSFKGSAKLPVEQVSWDDCQEFIVKLNARHPPGPGWKWALPSEAQWEWACRGGTTGAYAGDLDLMAWYSANSDRKTHPVGAKQANAYGLYDMHGNVWEWCADAYQAKLPGGVDPLVPAGSYRVYRSGSWSSLGWTCRSAYRVRFKPEYRYYSLGVRLAAVPAGR